MKLKTLLPILVFLVSGLTSGATEKAILSADLNTTTIMGELGTPLHTVHLVEGKVVDMTYTGRKADDGRRALQVLSVDGKVLKTEPCFDFPLPVEGQKPKVGTAYRFWAYETVQAAGYPSEAFEKMGKPLMAAVPLHFRPKLVVLKTLK